MLHEGVSRLSGSGGRRRPGRNTAPSQVVSPAVQQTPKEYDMAKIKDQIKQASLSRVVRCRVKQARSFEFSATLLRSGLAALRPSLGIAIEFVGGASLGVSGEWLTGRRSARAPRFGRGTCTAVRASLGDVAQAPDLGALSVDGMRHGRHESASRMRIAITCPLLCLHRMLFARSCCT